MGDLLKPKPPKQKKPAPMADPEDAKKVARRRQAELQARSGLQNTMLTDDNREMLG